MYGAVSATLRRDGTLNWPKFACCISTCRVFVADAPEASSLYFPVRLNGSACIRLMPPCRPGSTRPAPSAYGTPTSWNSPLVKPGPKWHTLQLPLPAKIFAPRCAASG